MASFKVNEYSLRIWSSRSTTNMIRVLTIFFVTYLVTACVSSPKMSIIDVSNRSSIKAEVSLVKIPETKDLFGQIGKAYSIDAGNQSSSIRIPFETTYELGKFDPTSLFIAKYSSKNKRFTPLKSQVNLKAGFVTAQYNGSGTYTLFGGAIGGINYRIDEICKLDIGKLDITNNTIRDPLCPVILCPNFADERNINFDNWQARGEEPFPLPGPSGGDFSRGNLCERCLDSFNVGQPTICERPRPEPPCKADRQPLLATAELTQRGAFDPAGENCFVTAKTSMLRVAATDLAPVSTGGDLSNIRLKISEGYSKCGYLKGTITGFTYDTDNVTQLESVPLTEDVFFIVPGTMLNNQNNYHFLVTGKQGSNTFAGAIAAQWFKRSGDLTIVSAPIEDALDETTELPGVLADFDHLGRIFPVRDGTNASILSPASGSATGIMFSMAAPIPQDDFGWGELAALRDDYNDANTYDARLAAAFLSEADRTALGLRRAGGAKGCGTSTWNTNVGRNTDVVLQEVAHNLCQIEVDSPNGRANNRWHTANQLIGTEGYNLLDETRIAAIRARSIMWPREFANRNQGFYETYEWKRTCERMTTDDYVGFQDPTPIDVANELGTKWPTSFSMIGSFDDKGRIRITRSYMTNEPRSEYVAYKSDYHVVFSDSNGRELKRRPLTISRATEHHEDKKEGVPETRPASKQHRSIKAGFTFISSMPSKTMHVTIVKDGEVLAKIDKSRLAPQINKFNVEKTKSGELVFNWNIEDKDSKKLSASILVSKDNGESFQPVTSNRKGKIFRWQPQFMAGGLPLLFELKVTDGFHVTKQRYKQKIVLRDKAPLVSIFSPQNNETIQPGQPFSIRGVAWDAEEGNLKGDNIVWTVDEKKIATGNRATVPGLKPGKHKISITGIDSKQQGRTFSITINVRKTN